MKLQTSGHTTTQLHALFCGVVLIILVAMEYQLGMELADDRAFFLSYAENMLKGEFWVWNSVETRVWGGFEPLYPLIALPMALLVLPEAAIVGSGLALASVSLAAVTLMLGHWFGVIIGFSFLEFSDRTLDYYAPEYERSLLWNDPALGIQWPFDGVPKLAAKDAAAKRLSEAEMFA